MEIYCLYGLNFTQNVSLMSDLIKPLNTKHRLGNLTPVLRRSVEMATQFRFDLPLPAILNTTAR